MPVSNGVLEKEVEHRLCDLFIIGRILLKEPEKLFLGGIGIFFDDLPQQLKGCAVWQVSFSPPSLIAAPVFGSCRLTKSPPS